MIRRINYDVTTDSFVGFVLPLNDGVPISQHYRTQSFNQLKVWFEMTEKSSLLNLHMIQHIPPVDKSAPPVSFTLSAYGTDSSFKAIDILRRWIFIFEQCLNKKTRILGFSTGKSSQR